MYAARAKNTQLDTLWADWLAQRSTCPFRFPFFYFSFVYVRWSSSSRAARLAAETRRQFEWMRREEKYTFFFVLFLPTPVRIAGPFQKFILNIFQAVDLFKTFAT
jgi:hypothetical protein